MADIVVRKGNGGQLAPVVSSEWEPFRVMRDLLRWDPFREMAPLGAIDERMGSFAPAFEVKETKDTFVFKADLPGVKEQDLEITVTGDRLTVAGKRDAEREEKGDRYYNYERTYGAFTRSFTLPEGADTEHVRAEMKEGVLTLAIPKKPGAQPKKIAVKSGEKH